MSRLGLDLMESRRRPSWRRGATAEPRTVQDVSSRYLVKQERPREIVIGQSFRRSRGWRPWRRASSQVRKILLSFTGKLGQLRVSSHECQGNGQCMDGAGRGTLQWAKNPKDAEHQRGVRNGFQLS